MILKDLVIDLVNSLQVLLKIQCLRELSTDYICYASEKC